MLGTDSNCILIKYCVNYKYNNQNIFSRQLLLSSFIVYRYLVGPIFLTKNIRFSKLASDILETYTNKF